MNEKIQENYANLTITLIVNYGIFITSIDNLDQCNKIEAALYEFIEPMFNNYFGIYDTKVKNAYRALKDKLQYHKNKLTKK